MTRVWWSPKTNSQRSALARFGTDWQIVSAQDPEIIRTVHGQLCWFIHPVGRPFEARWVPVEQVQFKEFNLMTDLADALARQAWIAQHVWIWSQDDDGTWRDHPFANEAAAAEFEAKGRQRGFPTSRKDPRNDQA